MLKFDDDALLICEPVMTIGTYRNRLQRRWLCVNAWLILVIGRHSAKIYKWVIKKTGRPDFNEILMWGLRIESGWRCGNEGWLAAVFVQPNTTYTRFGKVGYRINWYLDSVF